MIERLFYEQEHRPLTFLGIRLHFGLIKLIYTALIVGVTTLISKGIQF